MLNGVALVQMASNPGPSLDKRIVFAFFTVLLVSAFGLGIYAAVELINRLIERFSGRDKQDKEQDRGGSDG